MYFGIGQAQIVSIATETRITLPSHFGKMRARLSALAILALSAATLTSARADPPPLGQAVNFPEPMVVCKTHRELKELVEALRISVEAYDAKLKQLGVDRSECDVNTVSDAFVVESLDLGVVDFNHAQRRVWIVHFTNAAKDGWGLYEEAIASNAAAAIVIPT
jgi:hypothetical protein